MGFYRVKVTRTVATAVLWVDVDEKFIGDPGYAAEAAREIAAAYIDIADKQGITLMWQKTDSDDTLAFGCDGKLIEPNALSSESPAAVAASDPLSGLPEISEATMAIMRHLRTLDIGAEASYSKDKADDVATACRYISTDYGDKRFNRLNHNGLIIVQRIA